MTISSTWLCQPVQDWLSRASGSWDVGTHLAVIAVGQQHGQPVLAQPLGLARRHELVKDNLHGCHDQKDQMCMTARCTAHDMAGRHAAAQ